MTGNYDGIYTYSVKDFRNNILLKQSSRCIIIGKTNKSYRIRLMEATYDRLPDDELWVRKKSVLRSYFNNETKICDIYINTPAEQSCRACIQRCQRKYDLLCRK